VVRLGDRFYGAAGQFAGVPVRIIARLVLLLMALFVLALWLGLIKLSYR
jgi:hypothetical protein